MTASPHPAEVLSSIAIDSTQGAELRAQLFYSADTRTVYVRYRIRNDSAKQGLAVFDRGVYGDWAGALYAPGPVGTALIETEGDRLTVVHAAVPPPADDPLRRHAPLARVIAPGEERADESATQLTADIVPSRLRWCVGVATFDPSAFRQPQDTAQGTIWIAEAEAIAAQRRLCTPWYDVASERFES